MEVLLSISKCISSSKPVLLEEWSKWSVILLMVTFALSILQLCLYKIQKCRRIKLGQILSCELPMFEVCATQLL